MTTRRALSLSLAALAFALPLSIGGTNAALGLLTLILLWSLAAGRDGAAGALARAMRSPAFLALAIYAAWEAISALGGLDPVSSLALWPKDLHKLWVFAAVATALSLAEGASIAPAFGAGLGLHAVAGLWQGLEAVAGRDDSLRAHGFVHPVTYGEILGLGLIAIAAAISRPGRTLDSTRRRRAALGLLAAAGGALILNETRAIIAALAIAYAAVCLVEKRWRRRVLAATLLVVGVFVVWEVMPTGGRNLRSLFSANPRNSSHRSRLILWDIAWKTGLEHPVFGIGSGQYKTAFVSRYQGGVLDGQTVWSNAHNLYLHQFAERGLPGLLTVLAALITLAAGAWKAAKTRSDAWALAAWGACAAFFVMNLTETAWQTEQVATLFLFIWLLGAGPRPAGEIL